MDSESDWRLDDVTRQLNVERIGQMLLENPNRFGANRTAAEVERQICERSQSRTQYVETVTRLIMACRNATATQAQRGVHSDQQQHQGGGMMPQHPLPQQQLPGGPGVQGLQSGGMRMSVSQQQQQQMMMMQSQQQQQAQRAAMQPGMLRMGMMQPRMGSMVPMQGVPGGPPNMNVPPGMIGPPMVRGPPPMYGMNQSPHMTPAGSPNVSMMTHSPAGGQYINSPASQAGMPSPAGGGQRGMVPSPMSSANTPQNEPPNSQEDQQYLEKVKQLAKYIEPLRRMIARIGNEDQGKLDKMKKLMDILSNPNKRMPMETLKKCETVLNRMNFDMEGLSMETSSAAPSSSVNPLLEAIVNLKKTPQPVHLNHALQRTFGAPLEAIYGTEIFLPPLPKRRRTEEAHLPSNGEIPDILQGEIARLQSHFKVNLDPAQPINPNCITISLICQLEDSNLPSVPPITVSIPPDYPDDSPICDVDMTEYYSTPFLQKVQEALTHRLGKMPFKFTLSQLLSAWEMSVRAACSPRQVPVSQLTMLMGL